jgi:hypothetical protein
MRIAERKGWLGVPLVLMLAVLVGCQAEPGTPTSPSSPLPTPPLGGLAFSIDEPLSQGDANVSGMGPQNIPITIVDVTLMGQVLGRGSMDTDGHFVIPVDPPLIVNHRIGIMLDEQTTEIQYTAELLAQIEAARGDNAITIPQIGRVYDAASVQP